MKTEEKNKLKKYKELELMCKSLISVIGLHRNGLKSYDSVLIRAEMLSRFINIIIKNKKQEMEGR